MATAPARLEARQEQVVHEERLRSPPAIRVFENKQTKTEESGVAKAI
jgi:hypothetical protein